jgi:hypothetical protein
VPAPQDTAHVIYLPVATAEEGKTIFAHIQFDAALKKEWLASLCTLLQAMEQAMASQDRQNGSPHISKGCRDTISGMPNPFSGPPFTLPTGATYNSQPLPESAAFFFDTYGNATETLGEIENWIVANGGTLLTPVNTPPGASPLAVVDGVASGDYGQIALPTPPTVPYLPTMIGVWLIKGNFLMPAGLCFENDLAGFLERRSIYPSQPDGDKNFVQVGSGANAKMVGVASSLALQILAGSPASLAQAYWMAP